MGRSTDFSNCYIYHIKHLNGEVCYIGSTSNMNSRKSSHKYRCNTEKDKHYNLDIYQYIRHHGGFENFEIIPIKKIENISNKTELRIAERLEMEKFSNLKNMIGSYITKEEQLEKNREWKKNNPDYHKREDPQKRRETEKKYRENNREKIIEQKRKYREANKQKISEYQRQYRLKKKELKQTDQ